MEATDDAKADFYREKEVDVAINETYDVTEKASQPQREAQIRTVMERVDKTATRLMDASQRLGERLGDSVLRPSEPRPEPNGRNSDETMRDPSRAPLAGRLDSLHGKLVVLAERLEDYIERLEV